MSANPGRVAAAQALMAVELGSNLEDVLPELAPEGRDRGLAWFTAFGVLRCRGRIDAALRPFLRTPLGGLDPSVRAALRLGAFEILFARTKKHAAVHQGVEVAKVIGAKRAQGLVNAVLRRVQPDAKASAAEQVDAPPWLYARWLARYGAEATQRWFSQAATPPPLFVVGKLDGAVATDVDGVFAVPDVEGRIEELPGFDAGAFWVQDKASVKVADLLGDVDGKAILDACAAPGGKAFRLASRGAKVLAVDRSPERLGRVVSGAQRLGMDIESRVHDWSKDTMDETFDGVLVDAPCTALGTIRRNPEAKWRRQLVDVLSMPAKQGPILAAAADRVRPGGVVVYAVCSSEPEEGSAVVGAFTKAHPDFTVEETLTTVPNGVDEDGFFAARLRRSGG